jgi:hypothetical protein
LETEELFHCVLGVAVHLVSTGRLWCTRQSVNLIGSIGICAVSCFFEEMIAHMLQRKLPEGMTLTELPRMSRTPEAPERFRITLATGGEAPWKIKYHADKFDEV